MDLGGIQRTVQIARTRLFGEDDGNAAEMLRGYGSNTDAGRLDGKDLVDAFVLVALVQGYAEHVQQRNLQHEIQK